MKIRRDRESEREREGERMQEREEINIYREMTDLKGQRKKEKDR